MQISDLYKYEFNRDFHTNEGGGKLIFYKYIQINAA